MNNENSKNPDELSFWSQSLPLETETCFFILANALDVVMTFLLLDRGPEFHESNFLANFILVRYGFRGMVYFKFALVAFVVVIAQIIARTQQTTARWLLNVGTLIVGSVVIYSCYLWVQYSGYFG
ncbi:MAG: DUF5658 family protein [Planctomycetota bacterium]